MESRPQTFQDLMLQIESSQRELQTTYKNDDSEKSIQLHQQIHSLPMIFQWMEKTMEAIEQAANTLSKDKIPFLLAKYATVFPVQKIIELTSLLNVMSTLLDQFKAKMSDDSSDFDDSSDSDVSDEFTKTFGVDSETLEKIIMHGKELLKKVNDFSLECLAAEVKVAAMKIAHSSSQELLGPKEEKPQEEKSKKRSAEEAKLSDSPSTVFKQARKADDPSIPAQKRYFLSGI